MPDEGDVQWSNKVRVGYMDQHAQLEKGKTIREVLREAFQYLFDMEIEMMVFMREWVKCQRMR